MVKVQSVQYCRQIGSSVSADGFIHQPLALHRSIEPFIEVIPIWIGPNAPLSERWD